MRKAFIQKASFINNLVDQATQEILSWCINLKLSYIPRKSNSGSICDVLIFILIGF